MPACPATLEQYRITEPRITPPSNLVNTPGGAAFWDERCYVFGRDFQDHVKIIMSRQPDARAKAFGVVPVTRRAPTKSP